MRARTLNYFFGILFSRQTIYAYGIAAGITTAGQLLLISQRILEMPNQTETLPGFIEMYIETLLPVWIGTITPWNALIILINITLTFLILAKWTANYSRSY